MYISPINNTNTNQQAFTGVKLSNPKFTMIDGIKIAEPFIAKGNVEDSFITVKTTHIPWNENFFITYLTPSDIKNRIGFHEYIIRKEKSILCGFNIGVNPPQQKYGFGELLRLISIIHMKENNINSNTINSVNKAIPFHLKYHFIPNELSKIYSQNNIENALSLLERFQNRSANLKEEVSSEFNTQITVLANEIKSHNKLPKNYIEEMKDILSKYFKYNTVIANFENGGERDFSQLKNMTLSLDSIKAHSDYFNELFEKHNINYKI